MDTALHARHRRQLLTCETTLIDSRWRMFWRLRLRGCGWWYQAVIFCSFLHVQVSWLAWTYVCPCIVVPCVWSTVSSRWRHAATVFCMCPSTRTFVDTCSRISCMCPDLALSYPACFHIWHSRGHMQELEFYGHHAGIICMCPKSPANCDTDICGTCVHDNLKHDVNTW